MSGSRNSRVADWSHYCWRVAQSGTKKKENATGTAPSRRAGRNTEERVAGRAHDRTLKKRAAPCCEWCVPPPFRRKSPGDQCHHLDHPGQDPVPRGSLPRPGQCARDRRRKKGGLTSGAGSDAVLTPEAL
ncbi:hypothetical protein NDU88_009412 [Pleurodeles waltl]|uniref:Uncharacterized protein n=1 Tax=Pleurodeles waltl TaxID=8319 RepID=A0AAV7RZM8_PLEWA|nr:hypothetical protein NDU88_009412 [Pleurodeles waltl]